MILISKASVGLSFHHIRHLWLFHPSRGAEYCDQAVCLSVCPRAYLWNRWADFHEILCADPLWSWIGPPLAALRLTVRCVLLILWKTSRLAVMGATPKRGGHTSTVKRQQ